MADKFRTPALDWEDLRTFLALTRHQTLSATARALGVNHATVSRRVTALEAALGNPLFIRRPNGYTLTAEGRAVLGDASTMEEAALSVLRRTDTQDSLMGLVRLTTTRVLADGFLAQHLGPLHQRHPGLDIEMIVDSRHLSLARREADIALRVGPPKDSELVGRRVATLSFGFFGTEHRAAQAATGQLPPLIGFDEDSNFIAQAQWLAQCFPNCRFAFRSNSWIAQAHAARAGFGIALLPHYLITPECGLTSISLGMDPPPQELWLLVRPDLAKVPRVRVVADFLAELFKSAWDCYS